MKPDRIFLIRHGKSQGNVDKSIYKNIPDYAIQLTPVGVNQAMEAGERIRKITGDSIKFYVSPFWRTRQTFQEILRAFPTLKKDSDTFYEDPRLREQEWCGRLRKDGFMDEIEAERDSYGNFYYRFDGGESCADVFDRVSNFLDTLHRDFEKNSFPKNCVIVTHGMTLRVFLMRFLHLSVEEFERLKNPGNCQFVILELKGSKYILTTGLEEYKEIKHNYQFDWNND
jgi:broad specificity phosphatase PhoE